MLSKKSIIDIDSLTVEEVSQILERTDSFLEVSKRDVKKVPALIFQLPQAVLKKANLYLIL
jgi:aspartate carbamoyltransferase catalytic subunit